MKVVILAGGSGTRLWPLSRANYPKQFVKIKGKSLLSRTYERFLGISNRDDIYIITNEKYKFYVINDLIELNTDIEKKIILEPVGKNTAGAVILSSKFLTDVLKVKENEVLFITPSDHIIDDLDEFYKGINTAVEYAKKNYIVTFGIKPKLPHTGYGYIEKGDKISDDIYTVKSFREKPDIKTAEKYFKARKFYWNSGMFCFTLGTMKQEFKKYQKELYKFYGISYKKLLENFNDLKSISIDYAVMEKTRKAAVVLSKIFWSDVGSWESLSDVYPKDVNNNVKVGDIFDLNTKNSIIYSDSKKLISTVDIKDVIVVETDDALLIAKKGSGEKIREIVNLLKNQERKEVVEHTTVYRPWGSYAVLEEGPRYKIKKIFVKPKHKLSMQLHYHRSEHWVVIKGTARVIKADKEYIVHENESIYVPKSTKHRLENPGKVPLELIEVQNGEYVGEDDIVRFDDVYGRAVKK